MNTENNNFGKSKLDNGIVLLTETIPYVRSVSIGVWIKSGSGYENPDERGYAHFLEHLFFKGSKKYSSRQIAKKIEMQGGIINAVTSRDYTVFYIKIMDNRFKSAVNILLDIIQNPLFKKEDFGKEKKVIIEELDGILENPEDYLQEILVEKLLYGGNEEYSLKKEIESVKKAELEDIERFYYDNYANENIVISLAGNIEHNRAYNYINKIIGSRKSQKSVSSRKTFDYNRAVFNYLKKDYNQANVFLVKDGINYSDYDRFAWTLLNSYIGSGMSSVLYHSIREKKGLVYNIYSFLDTYLEEGVWGIYFNSNVSASVRVIKEILKVLVKIKDNGMSNSKLKQIKGRFKGNMTIGLESTSARMQRQALMEIYMQKYYTLDETFEFIDNVKLDDILRISKEMLDIDKLSLVSLSSAELEKSYCKILEKMKI